MAWYVYMLLCGDGTLYMRRQLLPLTDDANRCKLHTGFYKKEPLKRKYRSHALEIRLRVLLFSAAMDRKLRGHFN